MDMKKKLLALDIDGTLTNSDKEITPATLEKILEIQEMGHIVAIASGRPFAGIRRIAEKRQLDKFGGYVLCFNGGKIINCSTGEIVYQAVLNNEVVKKIFDYAQLKGAGMVTYEDDTVITGTPIDDYMAMEARLNFMEIRNIFNFREYITFPLNKCLMTAEDEKAHAIELELAEKYRGQVDVFRSEPFFVEIMPVNVNKATSLEKLLLTLDMHVDDLIACGDGYNDLTMIKYAGVGVAMANAQQIVKDNADYITLSNNEDGLVPVINKFIVNS